MRIVTILGSPRRGNCAAMLETLERRAEASDHDVQAFNLGRMDYTGCIACYACKQRTEACVVQDDLAPTLEAVAACDVLVVATPVYFGEVSAQLKGFIDRCFSFLVADYARVPHKSRLAPGKAMGWCIAQGHPKPERFEDIYPRYEYFFTRYLGFDSCRLTRATGVYEPQDIHAHPTALRDLDAMAASLFEKPPRAHP